MNDLGWTLGWLAVQVALVLLPAAGLLALASRKGPGSGAWAATVSLGMVVILAPLAFLPGRGDRVEEVTVPASRASAERPGSESKVEVARAAEGTRPEAGGAPAFARFRLAWSRFERRAAGPVAQVRSWGKVVAIVALVGSGVGLLRLVIGLWAVGLCRARGKLVDDPALIGLVEELRRAMGCGPDVEVREVADLGTPATAGWSRPMLLLPGDWRGWEEPERRAVVAHELAHVVRGDYAAGLLARVAVVLNYYHPMVRWMAGRLQLEQELAADALGARFAGGRASYLRALSRLALEREGRPSSWPARAFLPGRGTLIRRIAMLKDETKNGIDAPARSKAGRPATALGLLALTVAVASWKAPAQAQEYKLGTGEPPGRRLAVQQTPMDVPRVNVRPFEMNYIPARMNAVVAFRPAAIARRTKTDSLTPLIRKMFGGEIEAAAKILKVDMARPGFRKLAFGDIESVSVGINFGQPAVEQKNADGEKLHSMDFGGLTVRAVAPFDWAAFFSQWNLELEGVKVARGVYYKVKSPIAEELLQGWVIYVPDDRTIVFESEVGMKALLAREVPSSPAYLNGADWERASRGLVAIVVNNKDDVFAKPYDLGRPDDAMVLSLFKGVDRWIFGVADSNAIAPHAEVTGRDPQAAEAVERAIQVLSNLARVQIEPLPGPAQEFEPIVRMAKGFQSSLQVKHDGNVVAASAGGVGTLDDLGSFLKMVVESSMQVSLEEDRADRQAKANEAKAGSKTEKR